MVACANVGMLIFARTASRSGELAIRTALGASRTRVVSQLFAEALVFAALAAAVGLLVADRVAIYFLAVPGVEAGLPHWSDLRVSAESVAWALALAIVSAVIAGVVPALRVTGKAVQRNMQRAAAGRSGVRFGGMSSALIVADVGFAVAACGMAVAFSKALPEIPDQTAVAAEQFLSAEFRIPRMEIGSDAAAFDPLEFEVRVGAAQEALIRSLAAEPGVRGVAVGSALPGMDHPYRRIELDEDDPSGGFRVRPVVNARVDLDYFNALDQPILVGRAFDSGDLGDDRSVVIVNSTFLERALGGRNPIGRRVRYRQAADSTWYEIVGVVPDLGTSETNPEVHGAIYHPVARGELNPVRIAVRVGNDPEAFASRLRALASEADPTALLSDPVALDEVVSWNHLAIVWARLGTLGLVGVLIALSVSGVYALMSFTVAERTREIGIRTALGARRSSIMVTVAKRSLAQLGIGALLGMPLAGVFLSVFDAEFGSESSPLALTPGLGVGMMVLIGMLACTAPTLRALRIMPTEALREGG